MPTEDYTRENCTQGCRNVIDANLSDLRYTHDPGDQEKTEQIHHLGRLSFEDLETWLESGIPPTLTTPSGRTALNPTLVTEFLDIEIGGYECLEPGHPLLEDRRDVKAVLEGFRAEWVTRFGDG